MQEVADELAVSLAQVRALVRDRALVGVQIGGRGQWRVERARLEAYIDGLYAAAAQDTPHVTDDPTEAEPQTQAAATGSRWLPKRPEP